MIAVLLLQLLLLLLEVLHNHELLLLLDELFELLFSQLIKILLCEVGYFE